MLAVKMHSDFSIEDSNQRERRELRVSMGTVLLVENTAQLYSYTCNRISHTGLRYGLQPRLTGSDALSITTIMKVFPESYPGMCQSAA